MVGAEGVERVLDRTLPYDEKSDERPPFFCGEGACWLAGSVRSLLEAKVDVLEPSPFERPSYGLPALAERNPEGR